MKNRARIIKTSTQKVSTLVIALLLASVFSTPAQAVYDIAITRTAFGAGVASNVGITLNGFDANQSYQATVKFVDTATNLDATNGTLVASASDTSFIDGYTSYSGTKLGFKGTYAQVAAALASVTWNPSGASGNISIRIGIAPYAGVGKFYDANSGHYYQYVSTATPWVAARAAAEATSLYGLRGYLAEINTAAENNFIGSETSATNIWVGATEDATTAANYTNSSYNGSAGQRWIWAGAIETPLPTGTGAIAQSLLAPFSSWAGGEPNNDAKPGADCAVTNWGSRGFWNDLPCTNAQGYLIEFGGRSGETFTAAASTLTQTVVAKEAVTLGNLSSNVTCTFGVNCSFPLSLTDPTAKNSSNVTVPGTFAYTSSNADSTSVTAVSGGASVALVGAGSSTITATFTPDDTALYAGNSKSFTITVSATAPLAPSGLIATPWNGRVALSWTAGSNGGSAITDYIIQYSTNQLSWSTFADGTSTLTSVTVTGLTNGTPYFFRVLATNAINTSVASTVTSATPNVPPTPIDLMATPSNGSVALSWTAGTYSGPAITDYLIEYSTDQLTWSTYADGVSSGTTATVSGLTNGTQYFFRVSATNDLGTSATSTVASATPDVPPTPTGLSATPANGTVALSWTAGTYGGPAITDYLIEYSTDQLNWSTYADGVSTSTSETVPALTNGILYFFRVLATNALGPSAASNVVSATPNVPPAPTGLTATASNGSVALSWTAGTYGGPAITDYLIEYSTDGLTWSIFADGTSAATSATVPGLTNGTLYFFRVFATNDLGTSATSNLVSATPSIPPTPRTTPAPTPSKLEPQNLVESGTAEKPASLVERIIDELIEALKPVIVDIFSNPPANAPTLAPERALDLITSTPNKVLGNSPSMVLFDGQYQPSKIVILDETIAQVVAPTGGVMNLQAKNGETPIAVNGLGRVQMMQSGLVIAQGNGLAPNTEFAVYLFSEPTLLGVGKTNDKGEFFVSFEVAKKIPLGDHTLQVNGLLADGRTSSVSMPVSLVDQVITPEGDEMPLGQRPTDPPYLLYAVFAVFLLVLLILGSRWFLVAKRRRKDEE